VAYVRFFKRKTIHNIIMLELRAIFMTEDLGYLMYSIKINTSTNHQLRQASSLNVQQ